MIYDVVVERVCIWSNMKCGEQYVFHLVLPSRSTSRAVVHMHVSGCQFPYFWNTTLYKLYNHKLGTIYFWIELLFSK